MIYLNTNPEQFVSIIPRKTLFPSVADVFYYSLYNETTKQIIDEEIINYNKSGDVFNVELVNLNLTQETFYEFTILSDNEDIIYKDRIFCTEQNLSHGYSINDGVYQTLNTDNNYYITI